ncbi:hypothetical protein GCM10027341_35780 [Spirosoma knui]
MFGLDPFSRPVAIGEIVLLLAFAALVGWVLGRLVRTGRVNALRSAIEQKETELEACRRDKAAGQSSTTSGRKHDSVRTEASVDNASSYVAADPLLPALDHDDTPDLIVGELPDKLDNPARVATDSIPQAPPILMPSSSTGATSISNSEAAVLSRIAARAGELNFDRIGRATATEADDLKDIVGIGPFLERKLHSLGIYTFRQVANFTKEDINKVNEIIEFFPGRIERDNWVEQSKTFHERKYGART